MDDFKKSEVVTFDDELQALVDYGHDCCAHIDDKIHECCQRIKKAHDLEVGGYEIALGWKREQDQFATTYDTLGNERHKVVCELKRLRFSDEGTDFGGVVPPKIRVGDVCNFIGAFSKLQDDWPNTFATARDTLIHLLGGNQEPVKFKDLFGILREDDDGMDAAGRGVFDCANADIHTDERADDCRDGSDNQGEVLAPITQELRDSAERYYNFKDESIVKFSEGMFDQLCDAIDAIHANLEQENIRLHKELDVERLERALSAMHAAGEERDKLLQDFSYQEGALREKIETLEREVKRLESECKTQRNNFDQATSAREHWKSLYEHSLERIDDLERDYKTACDVNERQDIDHIELTKRLDNAIPLPFDKDGKVWHIGDELLDDGIPCEVVGVGPNRLYYYFDMTETVEWTQADGRRHYKRKPSVENVLVELLREYDRDDSELTDGEIVERFAARLRLAGDDE